MRPARISAREKRICLQAEIQEHRKRACFSERLGTMVPLESQDRKGSIQQGQLEIVESCPPAVAFHVIELCGEGDRGSEIVGRS